MVRAMKLLTALQDKSIGVCKAVQTLNTVDHLLLVRIPRSVNATGQITYIHITCADWMNISECDTKTASTRLIHMANVIHTSCQTGNWRICLFSVRRKSALIVREYFLKLLDWILALWAVDIWKSLILCTRSRSPNCIDDAFPPLPYLWLPVSTCWT